MKPPRQPRQNKSRPPGGERGWDRVAAWYDKLVGEKGSDYHQHVILPAALRLLAARPGEKILDLCCGQGVLVQHLLKHEVAGVTAVDASRLLIDAAKQRLPRDPRLRFLVADATRPGPWSDGTHDAAVCLMAVHDVADLDGLARNLAHALRPGGRAVVVMMHPCFRIPRQSHWGWDESQKIQFRRIDNYATPLDVPIITHPGRGTGEQTVFHHRPLAHYLTAFGAAGIPVVAAEELYSHRRSQAGPHSRAEHRAAQEFPLFLALVLQRTPVADA